MKKNVRRIISWIIVVTIVITMPLNVKAVDNSSNEIVYLTESVIGDVIIKTYVDEDGNDVICEFQQDGTLTQRNTILKEQNMVVMREFFDDDGSVLTTDYFEPSDVGIISVEESATNYAVSSGYLTFGKIVYQIAGTQGYETYTQVVGIRTSTKNTTYTLDAWKGLVVDLIAAGVSAGLGKLSVMQKFVPAFLTALGVTVIAGEAKEAITTTLSSTCTTYTWQLYDSVYQNETFTTGTKNYITESGDYCKETYYSGVTPKDWGTGAMLAVFYNATYADNNWDVKSWILLDGKYYI